MKVFWHYIKKLKDRISKNKTKEIDILLKGSLFMKRKYRVVHNKQ